MRKVKAAVAEHLEKVSLTGLDQTNMEYFNPSNAFVAEGLTRLTAQIERRKKTRNDIEQDTLIQIRNKNLEAEKLSLEIDRDSEYARMEQQREVEIRRATQQSDLAKERAAREREAEQARIESQQAIERARIASERALDEDRIARERELQRLEVERRKALELEEQGRAIAVAEQSKAQSEAQAAAETARAKAVAAEERCSRRERLRLPSGASRSSSSAPPRKPNARGSGSVWPRRSREPPPRTGWKPPS